MESKKDQYLQMERMTSLNNSISKKRKRELYLIQINRYLNIFNNHFELLSDSHPKSITEEHRMANINSIISKITNNYKDFEPKNPCINEIEEFLCDLADYFIMTITNRQYNNLVIVTEKILEIFDKFLEIRTLRGIVLLTLIETARNYSRRKICRNYFLEKLVEWIKDDDPLIFLSSLRLIEWLGCAQNLRRKRQLELLNFIAKINFEKMDILNRLSKKEYDSLYRSPLIEQLDLENYSRPATAFKLFVSRILNNLKSNSLINNGKNIIRFIATTNQPIYNSCFAEELVKSSKTDNSASLVNYLRDLVHNIQEQEYLFKKNTKSLYFLISILEIAEDVEEGLAKKLKLGGFREEMLRRLTMLLKIKREDNSIFTELCLWVLNEISFVLKFFISVNKKKKLDSDDKTFIKILKKLNHESLSLSRLTYYTKKSNRCSLKGIVSFIKLLLYKVLNRENEIKIEYRGVQNKYITLFKQIIDCDYGNQFYRNECSKDDFEEFDDINVNNRIPRFYIFKPVTNEIDIYYRDYYNNHIRFLAARKINFMDTKNNFCQPILEQENKKPFEIIKRINIAKRTNRVRKFSLNWSEIKIDSDFFKSFKNLKINFSGRRVRSDQIHNISCSSYYKAFDLPHNPKSAIKVNLMWKSKFFVK